MGVLAVGAAGVASGAVPVPARLRRAFQDTGPDGTIPAVPAGTVRLEQVTSTARGRQVGFYTAVPQGYGDGRGLPVCLILHGATATTARYEAFGFGQFLTAAVHGDVDPQLATAAATYKIFYSELHQRLTDLALDIQGRSAAVLTGTPDAAQPAGVGMGRRVPHYDYPVSALQATYLFSKAETIYGGTSNVQRNIIAQRVLGLPREPR